MHRKQRLPEGSNTNHLSCQVPVSLTIRRFHHPSSGARSDPQGSVALLLISFLRGRRRSRMLSCIRHLDRSRCNRESRREGDDSVGPLSVQLSCVGEAPLDHVCSSNGWTCGLPNFGRVLGGGGSRRSRAASSGVVLRGRALRPGKVLAAGHRQKGLGKPWAEGVRVSGRAG